MSEADTDTTTDAQTEVAATDNDAATPAPTGTLPPEQIERIVEAALQAADEPLTADRLYKLFQPGELAEEGGRGQIRAALTALEAASASRGVELRKVASGYRMQVRQEFSPWVSRLWDEKPPRYTRALLETLALIAYKQPATRGDIEEVRGVAVSPNIMRTLLERGWIREVGQRDVPGRPSMYGTTKAFLDYFNLATLGDLPTLPEVRELIDPQIEAVVPEVVPLAAGERSADDDAAADGSNESQDQQPESADAAEAGDDAAAASAHELAAEETATAEDVPEAEAAEDVPANPLDAELTVSEPGAAAAAPAEEDEASRPSADVVMLPGVESREEA